MSDRQWHDIKGGEDRYQVSSDGLVRSLPDMTKDGKCRVGKILKLSISEKGYLRAVLPIGTFRVHRLVAEAFIPNPNNLPQINHLNGVKTDNRVINLEWSSNSSNQKHRYSELGHSGNLSGKLEFYALTLNLFWAFPLQIAKVELR